MQNLCIVINECAIARQRVVRGNATSEMPEIFGEGNVGPQSVKEVKSLQHIKVHATR